MNPDKPTDLDAQISALWTAQHRPLRGFLISKLRGHVDHALTYDAIAEAFLRLRRTLQAGTEIPDPPAWLRLVAWREYLRLVKTRTAGGRVAHSDDLVCDAIDPADLEHQDLEQTETVEIAAAVARALRRLTPIQRTVITLYAEGNTYSQIAELTDLSHTGVNKAIVRAKNNLAQDGQLARVINGWRRP